MEPQKQGQSSQPDRTGQQFPPAFRPNTTEPTRTQPAAPGGVPAGRFISDFRPRTATPPSINPQSLQSAPTPTAAAPTAPAANVSISPLTAAATTSTSSTSTTPAPQAQTVTAHAHESFAKPAPPPVEPKEKPAQKSGLRDALSIAGVLVSALLLAFVLISFVFQSYQVDGPSMQTTLENNDHLIVWKVPKTLAKMTGQHYIPNRGDVVIFTEPIADGTGSEKQLIKRVMALPGERIVVKDGVVTVFNKDNPDGFQPDKTLPYGSVIKTTPGNVDMTLKENQVFVCGDNRTNSLDSRIFGPVNSDQLVGKLVLRVLPLNTVKAF